ncbi:MULTISPECIES: mandelate racemase/muconate lactonizing enzyme family protein [unclassified Chelatococcus]|uniref:mandelate racemase/muconate lactonizing enzyme family protein n=1 Tax=unclassified Chelatococcus TaxID=2638111 RepID=UPI001BCE1F77|nr:MULTISPECIES: mandelate racemase/muconate lactonizing enzyme family protein [unclassified Chelatococcus]MBS7700356.1 mandelate racemase/muconate lactonizing enzyme family protein [Chelatococcus sp. YT9]MBX3556152.1 mandelate racemase/muconate lactonizing enzyme family protein [Chelatococcus sp.]
MPVDTRIRLRSVAVHLFRAPVEPPMRTVFGEVRSRPALVLVATDEAGQTGYGEIWCNFPPMAAEYRLDLANALLPALVTGQVFRNPAHVTAELTRRLHTLALQAGEDGPLAQIISGLDMALWDLLARRAGCPMHRLIAGKREGTGPITVPVYASSIPPEEPMKLAGPAASGGHTAFKLRVGFGADRDLTNVEQLRRELGDDARLMIDANQSWTTAQATAMAAAFAPARIDWLEEPVPADRPIDEWHDIARHGGIPLAGGENVRGLERFMTMITEAQVAVVQPDVGKWGGISGALVVGRAARSAGLRFCPHWLAGGLGLAASLQVQAALGGEDLVELDANPNPLRQALCDPQLKHGRVILDDAPGLGPDDPIAALSSAAT